MAKKPFQSVPFDVLRKGFELAVLNGFSLLISAMHLVGEFPQIALGLAQLGQEELGKSFAILASISLADDDPDWGSFWSDWKNHEVKAYRAFYYELFNPMRLQLSTPEGEKLAGLARRSSMRAEKEASFYVNFDSESGRFLLPNDDVKREEVFNRCITASYLAKTADAIYQALEEDDSEFRYRAISELAVRACRELLSPPQMPPILAEFEQRSPQHANLICELNKRYAQERAWFTELIEKARNKASQKGAS